MQFDEVCADPADAEVAERATTGALVVVDAPAHEAEDAGAIDRMQHYPTPRPLAERFWRMFGLKEFAVGDICDVCAGQGDLTEPLAERVGQLCEEAPEGVDRYELHAWFELRSQAKRHVEHVDAIELDVSHHEALRNRGMTVVGLDVLEHTSFARYALVVANPPFAIGAKIALHVWDRLHRGSLGLILNAQTLLNACTPERRRLAEIVAEFGTVEFVTQPFSGPDAEREANVDVALVRLDKPEHAASHWIDAAIAEMVPAREQSAEGLAPPNEIALPRDFIDAQVLAYGLATDAARAAIRAEHVAKRTKQRIGQPMAVLRGGATEPTRDADHETKLIVSALRDAERDLLDRAWSSVLSSTRVASKLSAAAQRDVESRFEQIKRLAFTPSNIHGFLAGLAQAADGIQLQMLLDVFDELTRYTSDNVTWFRGWLSNDRHAKAGRRLRTNRLVLPGFQGMGEQSTAYGSALSKLRDIDQVFALLDGTGRTWGGLVDGFMRDFEALKAGERVSTRYFDIRFYKGIGTVHLFPTNQALLDRFNRIVGRKRRWLPPEHAQAYESFWKAHAQAERFTKRLREILAERSRTMRGRANPELAALGMFCRPPDDAGLDAVGQGLDDVAREFGMLEALEADSAAAALDQTPNTVNLPKTSLRLGMN